MTRTLSLLAILALATSASQAQVRDSLLWVQANIMFETVVDEPGLHPGRAVWKAPANAPAARSLAFGRNGRFTRPIRLQPNDGQFVGTGRIPAVSQIQAIRVTTGTGRYTIHVPLAGWEEGVAAARVVFEGNDENVQAATVEAQIWTDMRPDGAQFNIGMPPKVFAERD